jgi:hypothetical protein
VLGKYLGMSAGRVYFAFEREGNVGEVNRDERLPLMWALDFNVDPMCSVVAQLDHGRVNVLDEIVLGRASTQDACREFAARYSSHRSGLIVYADATGQRSQSAAGTSDIQVLKDFLRTGEYGNVSFKIPSSNPAVRDRVTLMNAKLESADGRRMLRVDPRCKDLIKDFEQVVYKEGSTQLIEKGRDTERTHLSDALGYLVWQECGGAGTVGEQSRPLF